MRNAVGGQEWTQVRIGEHGSDAGEGARLRHVDAFKPRMSMGRTQERGMQKARKLYVVGKSPVPTA